MLAMAVADNRLVVNPVDGVELPAVGAVEQRFLTLEQLHTLADAAGEHRPLVYVLGACGLRFGEVAELRWRDLDLERLTVRVARSVTLVDSRFVVGTPKGGKGRTISLPAYVADMRRRWWSQAVTAAGLFPRVEVGPDGEPRTVYEFKIHELRHTAASLAIQAGANIKSLQNMLGHESAALTLDRYGHLYGSDVDAVGVAMNALLTRKCGQGVVTEPVDRTGPSLQTAV